MASTRSIQRLFVGNLPWTVGHKELRNYFEQFGKVYSARVVFDTKTGLSKKYGFVAVDDSSEINDKINSKSKHILEGSFININNTK